MHVFKLSKWGFFLLFCCLFACTKPNVVLDNGAEQNRQIEIDGKRFEIVAGAQQEINLQPGNHTLVIRDAGNTLLMDTSFVLKNKGLVNAGVTEYVSWKLFYGLPQQREKALKEDWIEVDSTKYFGEIKYHPSHIPFLERSWDLGPGDPTPDEKTLAITQDFKTMQKLFRKADFVKKYESLQAKP